MIYISEGDLKVIKPTDIIFYRKPDKELEKYYISVEENEKLTIIFERAEQEIISSLNWNDLKIGEINEMENIVRELISATSYSKVLEWLNRLYLEYNENNLFLCTLFHTLSHMDYDDIYPTAPTMAMSALNNNNDIVVRYAVKAFSNWNSKDCIKYMRNNTPKQDWVRKEWQQVIDYIKINGDEVDELLNKDDWSE